MPAPGELSAQDVAKVAAHAGVDPRSVVRALQGRTRSALVRREIVAALRFIGDSVLEAGGDGARIRARRFRREALRVEKGGEV